MHITKRLRQIRNAWHFSFALTLVFTEQWFRFSGGVAHYLTRRYVSDFILSNTLLYTVLIK
ncbi:hypothetical protein CGI39_24445 [Vibrio parahaemolyticus]|nr:hypothetical protein CGI69_22560 [Vibrio parahaemolyticus]TOJ33529.1 hypothetical protein CGI40_24370 [Vibrio parahaemolyticus]TOJ37719.1 hypothetical protein CGI39_24445 [Vibrio parahaemolyticus]TOJ57996.1 hypothetical protein CGI36_23130 [Vibrio parahaemolyticus]